MKQTIIAIICFLCLSSSYIQAQKINHPSLLYTPQRIQQVKQRMQNEPKLQEPGKALNRLPMQLYKRMTSTNWIIWHWLI